MSKWLVPLAIGFPIGAVLASAPTLLRRMLIRRARSRLARTGLRPGLRIRVMITPDDHPDWAHLTIHVRNRTKDIWWFQQIDFPAGKVRGVLKSDRVFAKFAGDLSAVPTDALPGPGPLLPSRSIHPDDRSTAHFTGVADGTCEHAYLYYPGERDPIAVNVTLRPMGGGGRAITVTAVRPVSW
ncbi:hypothetical protein AWL63_10720 [Sphingomonas panacis]|uniref:Uncharacterized protein n=1 Tax=Sphingomonas panacis TaxID=1560345 RepID=A0A1B3ZAC9_9SPHN|nr:hypothetical protein [Sphingomonas panacis]AOH84366.1 hypothetical protein AWL63_10720 [Sphingomonas panacis]